MLCLQFLKGLTIFSNDADYYVLFSDVNGVSASTPVYANGYKVGVVKDLEYDYTPQGKIVAVMGLDKQMRLPRGSRAEIDNDLLGNIKINLVLGDDPTWQWAPYVLIVVLGHGLNFAMSCLGAFVHPLRLTFVEYFKNSGYEGKGQEYSPLTNEIK